MLLALIYVVILMWYWFQTTNINIHQHPNTDPEKILAWRAFRLQNCRRYAGLFLIYIVLLFGVSLLVGYSTHHHQQWLAVSAVYFELAYMVFVVAVIIWSMRRTRRKKREIGISA